MKEKLDCALRDVIALSSERDALSEAVDCATAALHDVREGLACSYEALDIKFGLCSPAHSEKIWP